MASRSERIWVDLKFGVVPSSTRPEQIKDFLGKRDKARAAAKQKEKRTRKGSTNQGNVAVNNPQVEFPFDKYEIASNGALIPRQAAE